MNPGPAWRHVSPLHFCRYVWKGKIKSFWCFSLTFNKFKYTCSGVLVLNSFKFKLERKFLRGNASTVSLLEEPNKLLKFAHTYLRIRKYVWANFKSLFGSSKRETVEALPRRNFLSNLNLKLFSTSTPLQVYLNLLNVKEKHQKDFIFPFHTYRQKCKGLTWRQAGPGFTISHLHYKQDWIFITIDQIAAAIPAAITRSFSSFSTSRKPLFVQKSLAFGKFHVRLPLIY